MQDSNEHRVEQTMTQEQITPHGELIVQLQSQIEQQQQQIIQLQQLISGIINLKYHSISNNCEHFVTCFLANGASLNF